MNEQPFATTQPGANAAAMWKMATSSIYESGDLPVLAIREMVQNSVDAIRARRQEKSSGLIEILLTQSEDASDKRSMLQVRDNGTGMSSDTFVKAFMVLGVSTKKTDGGENVGGFGMAKAVILGASSTFSWKIRSQDWEAVAENSSDVSLYHRPNRVGTEITIYDWDEKEFRYFWDGAANATRSIKDRVSDTLSANHLPDIRVTFNGLDVHPRFPPARGTPMNLSGNVDWDRARVEVRKFKHTGASATQFYVRARGLLQFRVNTGTQLKSDIVIDVTPTVAPGEPGFPFSASREAFHGKATRTFFALREHLRLEAQTLERSEQEELMEPEAEQSTAAHMEATNALQNVLNDEELKAQLGPSLLSAMSSTSRAAGENSGSEHSSQPSHAQYLDDKSGVQPTSVGMTPTKRSRKPGANPLGNLGYVLIQKDVPQPQQQSFRRRIIKFVPMLSFWRLLVALLMQKVGRSVPYHVGLMLSTKVRAAWEARTPKGIFWINPMMMLEAQKNYSTIQKWAALWWSTAVHELTHAFGQMNHNDAFIYLSETLQEQTIDSLPTIERLMKRMLSPNLEETEHPDMQRLRREVKALSKAKLSATERTQQIVSLRQQLKMCQEQLKEESLATAASAERECHGECSVHEHRTDEHKSHEQLYDAQASHEGQESERAAALVQQWFEAWWQETDESQQPALLEAVKTRYEEYLAQAREVLHAH